MPATVLTQDNSAAYILPHGQDLPMLAALKHVSLSPLKSLSIGNLMCPEDSYNFCFKDPPLA